MVTLGMHTKHQFIIWTEFLFEVYLRSSCFTFCDDVVGIGFFVIALFDCRKRVFINVSVSLSFMVSLGMHTKASIYYLDRIFVWGLFTKLVFHILRWCSGHWVFCHRTVWLPQEGIHKFFSFLFEALPLLTWGQKQRSRSILFKILH